MVVNFEYKNMAFEKNEDGVWIHKDWAVPGDFGEIYDKPANPALAEKIELAYQVYCLEKKISQKSSNNEIKPKILSAKSKVKKDPVELDLTKPLDKKQLEESTKKVSKKTSMVGWFNPLAKPSAE